MTAQYSLYSSTLTPASPASPLVLNQITGRDVAAGLRLQETQLAGAVDRAGTVILDGDPMVTFRSEDLETILTAVSLTTGFRVAEGAVFRYQKRGADVVSGSGTTGPFTTGSTHRTVTSPKGFLIPVSISAAQNGIASIVLTYFAYESDDGATRPFVLATSQGLSSAPALNSQYTMGPATLDGAVLDGLQSWEFQTGLSFVTRKKNGRTYPNEGRLISRLPRLVLKFDTPEIADSVGSYYHSQLSAAIKVFARKKSLTTTDGNVSDASSAHMAITIAAGSWKLDDESANNNDDVPGTVTIMPTGTVSMSLAAAISS